MANIMDSGARSLSLTEMKAQAYDAAALADHWSERARALHQAIETIEQERVRQNGKTLDSEKAGAAS